MSSVTRFHMGCVRTNIINDVAFVLSRTNFVWTISLNVQIYFFGIRLIDSTWFIDTKKSQKNHISKNYTHFGYPEIIYYTRKSHLHSANDLWMFPWIRNRIFTLHCFTHWLLLSHFRGRMVITIDFYISNYKGRHMPITAVFQYQSPGQPQQTCLLYIGVI